MEAQKTSPRTATSVHLWAQYKGLWCGGIAVLLVALASFALFSWYNAKETLLQLQDNAPLERALRDIFQKPYAPLTVQDLKAHVGKLSLASYDLTNIAPLQYIEQTTILNLESNIISDITPLAALSSLVIVSLAHNPISDISPLYTSKQTLIGLSLANTALYDMRQLRVLKNIEFLDIVDTPITDLELGNHLRKLKTITLNPHKHGLSPIDFITFQINLPPNCKVKFIEKDKR